MEKETIRISDAAIRVLDALSRVLDLFRVPVDPDAERFLSSETGGERGRVLAILEDSDRKVMIPMRSVRAIAGAMFSPFGLFAYVRQEPTSTCSCTVTIVFGGKAPDGLDVFVSWPSHVSQSISDALSRVVLYQDMTECAARARMILGAVIPLCTDDVFEQLCLARGAYEAMIAAQEPGKKN